MSGFRGLPVPSFFIASGTGDVPDGYEPTRARSLDLGEVQAQLLSPAPGGVRGLGLIIASPGGLLSLVRGLSGGVLGLARYLARRVLRLLSGPAGRFLRLARNLARLVGGLPGHILRLLTDTELLMRIQDPDLIKGYAE